MTVLSGAIARVVDYLSDFTRTWTEIVEVELLSNLSTLYHLPALQIS